MVWKLPASSGSRTGRAARNAVFDDGVEECSAEKGLAVLLQGIAQSRGPGDKKTLIVEILESDPDSGGAPPPDFAGKPEATKLNVR